MSLDHILILARNKKTAKNKAEKCGYCEIKKIEHLGKVRYNHAYLVCGRFKG